MSEDPSTTPAHDADSPSADAWKEVGKQFEVLGDSLSKAFRAAWNDEENRKVIRDMQTGLESMVQQIGKAIDDTAKSTEGQHIRAEAEKAAVNLKNAGEQTVQEIRPHLVTALRQVNDELQKFTDRMERKVETTDPTAGEDQK